MRSFSVEEINNLSDRELREELTARGEDVGPITDFTRLVF